MSQKSEETQTTESGTNVNEVGMLVVKKAITRKSRVPKSKNVEVEKNETKVEPHVEPYVGTSVTRKKYVTKMKSLKRKHVQSNDSDSNADEDWVSRLSSRSWSGQ